MLAHSAALLAPQDADEPVQVGTQCTAMHTAYQPAGADGPTILLDGAALRSALLLPMLQTLPSSTCAGCARACARPTRDAGGGDAPPVATPRDDALVLTELSGAATQEDCCRFKRFLLADTAHCCQHTLRLRWITKFAARKASSRALRSSATPARQRCQALHSVPAAVRAIKLCKRTQRWLSAAAVARQARHAVRRASLLVRSALSSIAAASVVCVLRVPGSAPAVQRQHPAATWLARSPAWSRAARSLPCTARRSVQRCETW